MSSNKIDSKFTYKYTKAKHPSVQTSYIYQIVLPCVQISFIIYLYCFLKFYFLCCESIFVLKRPDLSQ